MCACDDDLDWNILQAKNVNILNTANLKKVFTVHKEVHITITFLCVTTQNTLIYKNQQTFCGFTEPGEEHCTSTIESK